MDLKLTGKRALVLGSSTGIGLAIAKEFVREGVSVCLHSRSEKRLIQSCQEIGASTFVVGDLSQPGAGKAAVLNAAEKLGGLDILVTNAGGPPKGSFSELSSQQWQEAFQSLFMGVVESVQAAIPFFEKNRWGRVLLVTSTAAKEPIPGLTLSNGLRAGLLGLTKSISKEVGPLGITINALLPGYTRTERLFELGVQEEKVKAAVPAGRLGEPEEIAALAAFLGSERGAYITGQAIAVDGGRMQGI